MVADPFWSNLFRRRDEAGAGLHELLESVPVFADLSRREFARLAGVLHRRTVSAGEAVVREGETGVGMYVIATGEVRIVQRAGDDGDQLLVTLGPGDFFGEQALLDEAPRTGSAIAVEPCEVVGFFRPDLLGLIDRHPRMGLKIIMRLSQMVSVRLRHTNRLLKDARARARRAEQESARASAADGVEAGPGAALEAARPDA